MGRKSVREVATVYVDEERADTHDETENRRNDNNEQWTQRASVLTPGAFNPFDKCRELMGLRVVVHKTTLI